MVFINKDCNFEIPKRRTEDKQNFYYFFLDFARGYLNQKQTKNLGFLLHKKLY